MEKMDGISCASCAKSAMVFAGICRKDIHLQIDGCSGGSSPPPPGDEEDRARADRGGAFGMSEEALRARGEAFRTEQARRGTNKSGRRS